MQQVFFGASFLCEALRMNFWSGFMSSVNHGAVVKASSSAQSAVIFFFPSLRNAEELCL